MLDFVICDDNGAFLSRFEKKIESIFIQKNLSARVVLTAKTSEDVLKFLENNKVHVLILDIDLKSSLSGIELAEKVRETDKDVYIIFITGHLEYILQAYKVKTFDFLPKPVTTEKIEETLDRLFEDISISKQNYINISNKIFLNTNDIDFIKKEGMKITFYTGNREYHDYISFSKIEKILPQNFIRCHKSYIINVEKISKIDYKNNSIYLKNNIEECFIGPTYKSKIKEVMNYGNYKNINHT